jgi:hypothetical protein
MSGVDLRKARDLGHLRIAEEELRRQKALTVKYNAFTDMLEIEGITYAADFFRQFAKTMPLNTPLKIMSREGGVLTIAKMEPGDPDWKACSEGE